MEILKKTILQAVTTGTIQGNWNANTNVPNIENGSGSGDVWYVSVTGNTVLGDIDTWNVGDWAIKYDGGWGKWKNDYGLGTTGCTGTCFVIIPDFNVDYYMVIGLLQRARDAGFFDAWIEPVIPEPPIPPVETFYLVDSAGNILYDPDAVDGGDFCY